MNSFKMSLVNEKNYLINLSNETILVQVAVCVKIVCKSVAMQ